MATLPRKPRAPSAQKPRIHPTEMEWLHRQAEKLQQEQLAAAGRAAFPFVLPAPYHHWSEYEHDLRQQTKRVWEATWRQYDEKREQIERDSAAWEDHLRRRRKFRDANGRFPGPGDDY